MACISHWRDGAGTVHRVSSVPNHIIYTIPLSAIQTQAISHSWADDKPRNPSIHYYMVMNGEAFQWSYINPAPPKLDPTIHRSGEGWVNIPSVGPRHPGLVFQIQFTKTGRFKSFSFSRFLGNLIYIGCKTIQLLKCIVLNILLHYILQHVHNSIGRFGDSLKSLSLTWVALQMYGFETRLRLPCSDLDLTQTFHTESFGQQESVSMK